jgi:hypothetical protein
MNASTLRNPNDPCTWIALESGNLVASWLDWRCALIVAIGVVVVRWMAKSCTVQVAKTEKDKATELAKIEKDKTVELAKIDKETALELARIKQEQALNVLDRVRKLAAEGDVDVACGDFGVMATSERSEKRADAAPPTLTISPSDKRMADKKRRATASSDPACSS